MEKLHSDLQDYLIRDDFDNQNYIKTQFDKTVYHLYNIVKSFEYKKIIHGDLWIKNIVVN